MDARVNYIKPRKNQSNLKVKGVGFGGSGSSDSQGVVFKSAAEEAASETLVHIDVITATRTPHNQPKMQAEKNTDGKESKKKNRRIDGV